MAKRLAHQLLKKPSRLSRRKKISVLLVLVFIGAGWLALNRLQGPAQGIISPTSTINGTTSESTQDYIRYEGQHASFSYPEAYRLEKDENLTANILESYRLISPGTPAKPSWTVAITVYTLTGPNLDENSSYKIRNSSPQVYTKSTVSQNGRQITYFKKNDSSEIVTFIRVEDRVAAIAVSGALHGPSAVNGYNRVVGFWQWK